MNMLDNHPEELLPWYANQTLEAEEYAVVEEHLAHCEHCRNELVLLQRLREEIKQEMLLPANEFGLNRLRKSINQQRQSRSELPGWLRPAIAAGILILLVQSTMLVNYWPDSSPITPLGVNYQGVVLQMTFSPDATEREIRMLLNEVNATLIGGPGELGVYRVRLVMDAADDVLVKQRIASLQSHPSVVTHVMRE